MRCGYPSKCIKTNKINHETTDYSTLRESYSHLRVNYKAKIVKIVWYRHRAYMQEGSSERVGLTNRSVRICITCSMKHPSKNMAKSSSFHSLARRIRGAGTPGLTSSPRRSRWCRGWRGGPWRPRMAMRATLIDSLSQVTRLTRCSKTTNQTGLRIKLKQVNVEKTYNEM